MKVQGHTMCEPGKEVKLSLNVFSESWDFFTESAAHTRIIPTQLALAAFTSFGCACLLIGLAI